MLARGECFMAHNGTSAGADCRHVQVRHLQMQLMRIQPQGAAAIPRLGPTAEPALRKPFLANPETLPIVGQALDRVPAPRAKYEQGPLRRIDRERLAAKRREAVDPLAKIDRFDRQQNPHLRSDLDHAPARKIDSTKAPSLTITRVPSGRATSIVAVQSSAGILSPFCRRARHAAKRACTPVLSSTVTPSFDVFVIEADHNRNRISRYAPLPKLHLLPTGHPTSFTADLLDFE
jgi:hypothetical protein